MATKARIKWTTKATDYRDEPFHYFASSVAQWKVGGDLEAVLRVMKKEDFPFNVYRVKLPLNAEYKISGYAPVLDEDQCVWVGFWKPEAK